MNHLYIIIIKPLEYEDSKELTLAFNTFCDNFRNNKHHHTIILNTQHSSAENDSLQLDSRILNEINKYTFNDNDIFFFVKESAIMICDEVIKRISKLLDQNNDTCIVPASYPHEYPQNINQQYFTLTGYQHYVSDELKVSESVLKQFDGRKAHFFAVTHAFLCKHHIKDHFFQIPLNYSNKTAIASAAYIHPFSDYFHGANLDILKLIPESARTLLDIGCSSGEFGQAVIRQYNLHVTGIEINENAASIARQKLHKVYQGDALSLVTNENFDCVTCLDVLEHFPDVDKLLQRISSHYLKNDGVLLLNLPNIGHWSIVDDLLSGHWDYLPGGTLCNTHLQFFTRNTILDMMKRNQYVVAEIIPGKVALPDKIEEQYKTLEKNAKEIDWENLKTINFKVIAHKSRAEP